MPYPRDSEAHPLIPEDPCEGDARRRPTSTKLRLGADHNNGQLAADIADATGEEGADGIDPDDQDDRR